MTTQTTPKPRGKSKSAYVNARVTPTLKHDAERVLVTLGVSTTEAIPMFLRQVVLHQGLPFPVRIPNAETVAAIQEAKDHPERLRRYENFADLVSDLDREIASEKS